jgi:hypothetical protein
MSLAACIGGPDGPGQSAARVPVSGPSTPGFHERNEAFLPEPVLGHHLAALTAWRRWEPSQEQIPANFVIRYGRLTVPSGVQRTVWVFVSPPGSCLSTRPLPRTARCREWTFLNARTGEHILSDWQRVRS